MFKKIKKVLATVSRLIIAAPLKLPRKIVAAAKYVALAIGLLDALEQQDNEGGSAT